MSAPPGVVSAAEYIALAYVAGNIFIALFTIFRNTCLRARYEKRTGKVEYTPSCAVVIPTKGLPRDAEQNFLAYLTQDYPSYRVYFVVESEDDEGAVVLRSLAESRGNARLVVAGLSVTGCQQNHNMIAGAREAGGVDVIVFADNDIRPDPRWLRRLVNPLSDKALSVTTAYRWLVSRTGSWGEDGHIYMNMTLYGYFSVTSAILKNALWGGSFAIRRRDYEALDVSSRWNETVSDDMSLGAILARNGKKAFLIPGFLIVTDDVIASPRETAGWFTRQLLNVKACQRPVWAFVIMPALLLGLGLYCLIPLSFVLSVTTPLSFRECGGGAAAVFLAGELVLGLLYSLFGPVRNRLLMILRIPLSRFLQFAGALGTIGGNSLTWAGVEYRFDKTGRITEIIRES